MDSKGQEAQDRNWAELPVVLAGKNTEDNAKGPPVLLIAGRERLFSRACAQARA